MGILIIKTCVNCDGPRGKGKARGQNDENQENGNSSEDVDTNMDYDDDKFEKKYRDRILASLSAKHNILGGVAEYGIIEYIEMHQFMCHRYLSFAFGPQINFIIVHNGSGKSDILSAITVALGGRANSTGRGNGLKSFIRERQSVAEVIIHLKNQGEEAYKPHEYRKTIVIVRRFTKNGSSSWKIQTKEGKIISTKRDEVSTICDHMNIQVDNPMNVLTQDLSTYSYAARQFLSASSKQDKYKLFLRGTQLSQLVQEYDTCHENIIHTSRIIEQKGVVLPDLRSSLNEAKQRLREVQRARYQKKRVDELKKELVWAHVNDKKAEMTDAINEVAELKARQTQIQQKLQKAQADFDAGTAAVTRYEEEITAMGDIADLTARKEELGDELRSNKRLLREMLLPQILERIKRMRWKGDLPIGPLGVHVKVHDPQKWAELLRRQLRGFLVAWAVTDGADLFQLRKLLNENGNAGLQIVVAKRDLTFDYSSGEPPARYLTALRALEISDPYVTQMFVNQYHIESIFLASTRSEGDAILRDFGRGGFAWTTDGFLVRQFHEGGGSSSGLPRPKNDVTRLLLSGHDIASEKINYHRELERHQRERDAGQQFVDQLNRELASAKRDFQTKMREERAANEAILTARSTLKDHEAAAQDALPINIAGLEDANRIQEEEKRSLEVQFEAHYTRKSEIDAAQKELLTKLKDVKADIDEFGDRRDVIQAKAENAAEKRTQYRSNFAHYERKLADETTRVEQVEANAEVLQADFQEWSAKAEEYCERVDTRRKPDGINRNIEAAQAALEERERRNGASVEDMTTEVNRQSDLLETIQRDIGQMASLVIALKNSLTERSKRWHDFLLHIALRCKLIFQFNLSNRGYWGKVIFKREDETLELRVQTDEQAAAQGSKDPRSLSGGEKSYSTICFLLSLWEAIGCPLRCLDEFDVFMDVVNRRVSMNMMIETAKQSDKKQYILITPQDVTNVMIGTSVRLHRMPDPERNQGMLSFR
ncbi:P-loop containing nucleoside triphosphate hydrolase protein [Guyanagaster necrorhizus]|uniref:P-loop containing nucleoside triphosphate hydrolase protein n=1 Tax=Guyanagaster necrorhizus TaxID=856835 RepID=A0A9P8ALN7_9AGAR|nr:P-loop containing nucleoside triphosphate hydrolase protein [Guyanagaster necrorhizus MCA 3950]KAG7439836.1 P-loop containing nucleoside triphosphate hydrolase protein [Guyanagaster necrorhizus MCA 3950]